MKAEAVFEAMSAYCRCGHLIERHTPILVTGSDGSWTCRAGGCHCQVVHTGARTMRQVHELYGAVPQSWYESDT